MSLWKVVGLSTDYMVLYSGRQISSIPFKIYELLVILSLTVMVDPKPFGVRLS
jgi:hypothetical protein